jgi:hypothetical protein
MGGLLLMWSLNLSSKGDRNARGGERMGGRERGRIFRSIMAGRLGGISGGELGTVI